MNDNLCLDWTLCVAKKLEKQLFVKLWCFAHEKRLSRRRDDGATWRLGERKWTKPAKEWREDLRKFCCVLCAWTRSCNSLLSGQTFVCKAFHALATDWLTGKTTKKHPQASLLARKFHFEFKWRGDAALLAHTNKVVTSNPGPGAVCALSLHPGTAATSHRPKTPVGKSELAEGASVWLVR